MDLTYARNPKGYLEGKYAKVLERLLPAHSVLEIGCYVGSFSRVLMERGYEVLGIEKDEQAYELAKANGVEVIKGDIEDPLLIDSIDKKFDVILLMDVLEHLVDPETVLRRIKTLLDINGRIMITGPNVAYWAIRKDLLLGRWCYTEGGIQDKRHLRWYTALGWKELIEDAGYKIILFEPVEGMIPFEGYFYNIKFVNFIFSILRDKLMHLLPGLFALTYFIEAIFDEKNLST